MPDRIADSKNRRSRVESLESRRLLSSGSFWETQLGMALAPVISEILMPADNSGSGSSSTGSGDDTQVTQTPVDDSAAGGSDSGGTDATDLLSGGDSDALIDPKASDSSGPGGGDDVDVTPVIDLPGTTDPEPPLIGSVQPDTSTINTGVIDVLPSEPDEPVVVTPQPEPETPVVVTPEPEPEVEPETPVVVTPGPQTPPFSDTPITSTDTDAPAPVEPETPVVVTPINPTPGTAIAGNFNPGNSGGNNGSDGGDDSSGPSTPAAKNGNSNSGPGNNNGNGNANGNSNSGPGNNNGNGNGNGNGNHSNNGNGSRPNETVSNPVNPTTPTTPTTPSTPAPVQEPPVASGTPSQQPQPIVPTPGPATPVIETPVAETPTTPVAPSESPEQTPVAGGEQPSSTPASASAGAVANAAPNMSDPAAASDEPSVADEGVQVQAVTAVPEGAVQEGESEDVAKMLSDASRFGTVAGFATSEKAKRALRRQAVRVQTIREFIAIDPEHKAQVGAIMVSTNAAQQASSESAGQEQSQQPQQQQPTIAAASLSRNFRTEATSTRNINILAAVAAGASVLAARYQRWRKRRMAEAAAARLASMLQFDPLAAWLDDERHRRG